MSLSKVASPLKYTFSEKQNKQLVVDNHIYNKHITKPNGDIYWTCTQRCSKKDGNLIYECKSACTTRDGQLVKEPTPHNHVSKHTTESIELNQNLKEQIKKRARTDKKNTNTTII